MGRHPNGRGERRASREKAREKHARVTAEMGYFRYPHTHQEMVAAQDGYCRPSRRPHNLPNAYDDIPISTPKFSS